MIKIQLYLLSLFAFLPSLLAAAGKEKHDAVLLSPSAIDTTLSMDLHRTESWFVREEHALLVMALGILISSVVCFVLAMAIRGLLLHHRKNHKCTTTWQELAAWNGPFWLFTGIVAAFMFARPVFASLEDSFSRLAVRLCFTGLTLAVVWGLLNQVDIIDAAIRRVARQSGNMLDNLLLKIIRKTLKIVIIVLAVLFVGQAIFDLNITTLLAGAGVIGLAIALAARDTLTNFFGTIVIIIDRPFRINDRVKVSNIDGVVEDVGMRSTRIRTEDESVFSIPNSFMVTTPVENISTDGLLRYAFTLTLTYNTTAEQVQQAIDIMQELTADFHGKDAPDKKPRVYLKDFGDWAIIVQVIMWLKTTDFQIEEGWKTELQLKMLKRFREAGIEWAFPTNTTLLGGSVEAVVSEKQKS